MANITPKLILVTNKQQESLADYLNLVNKAVAGGVQAVQLRQKQFTSDKLLAFGSDLQRILQPYKIPLIINDHLDICLKLDSAGVHLGQDDADVMNAREILGKNKIIGLSVNNFEQLEQANTLPIDYVGIGAVFPTQNKPNIETIWGVKALAAACKLSHHPVIAIGGINDNNIAEVMQAGAHGVAAIGAFHNVTEPQKISQNFINTIKQANNYVYQ